MHVQDLSQGDATTAWLFAFNIDSPNLKSTHLEWLERRIVLPLSLENIGSAGNTTSADHAWQIWVLGGTSRTGSDDHNIRLSKRRAEAVRTFLAKKMGQLNVVWAIDTVAGGEFQARLRGHDDDVENAFDRGILVIMQKVKKLVPNPKPPVISNLEPPKPPEITVQFYLYADRASFMKISKWKAELYAVYTMDGREYYDGWLMSTFSGGISLSDILPSAPGPSTDVVWGGPAKASIRSVMELDRLNGKNCHSTVRGKTISMRVEKGKTSGDLSLVFPSSTSLEVSYGIGSLSKRKRLTEKIRKAVDHAIRTKGGTKRDPLDTRSYA